MIKDFIHWLAHLTKQNRGEAVFWMRQDGVRMVAFKCAGCGKKTGIHPLPESFGVLKR